MKIDCPNRSRHGMTMLEALFVMFLLFMLAIVIMPLLARPTVTRQKINCVNNLKQVGLAFRIWEGDHNDKYPMAVSVTNGGAMEAVLGGDAVMAFQVMSNELSIPKILYCPEDKLRHLATNFTTSFTKGTLSYFVNPDAVESNPEQIMSGDDNFLIRGEAVKSGLLMLSSNTPVAWSGRRHKFSGNLGLADGSVQSANNALLAWWLDWTNHTTVRLAIP